MTHYELLGISQNANEQAIKEAVRRMRRTWNTRATHPNPTIRGEAEEYVRKIGEAERTLLDRQKRAEYDRSLGNGRPQQPQPGYRQQEWNDEDWEKEYFRYFDIKLYEQAKTVALNATRRNTNDGRAWFLYGEALYGLNENESAIQVLRRASLLCPNDPQIFRTLGFCLHEMNRTDEAINAFRSASRLDPHNTEYYRCCAALLRIKGNSEQAIDEARKAYNIEQSDENKREFFLCMHARINDSMSYDRTTGRHLITNERQLRFVRNSLGELNQLIPEGEDKKECQRYVDKLVSLVADAESKKGRLIRKKGYKYNYGISSTETRRSGLQEKRCCR